MGVVLIVLEVIVSILLMGVILVQSGKENGLGAMSGNTESYMNKGGRMGLDKMLASVTKWIALVWVGLAIALYLVY